MGPNLSVAVRQTYLYGGFFRTSAPSSMPSDPSTQARDVAIAQLEALGLSTYAARTFVALTSFGGGTAQDVSDVSDVPRTRVYDAVEELQERGLVDVQQSSPKQFWAISSETTGRHFDQEYTHRVNALTEALDGLQPISQSEEQRGVWSVTGRDTVSNRICEFIESADDEVAYVTVDGLLTDEIVRALRAASARGVSVKLGAMSEAVESDIREEVPDAELFDSLWIWTDTPAGRLLMVDETKTLASVLVPGSDTPSPESQEETAIWGSGSTNSLVVVLKAMFTWHLDGNRS